MRVPARTKSLTVRLVATSVALVALVSVLVVLATSLVMNQYLTSRLDQQVHASMDRAINPDGHHPGGPGPADGDDAMDHLTPECKQQVSDVRSWAARGDITAGQAQRLIGQIVERCTLG